MNIKTIINQCIERGVVVRLADGNLDIKAPKGSLTPGLINKLKEHKTEIISWLKEGDAQKKETNYLIEKAPKGALIPLSSNQLRLWLMDQMGQLSTTYNVPTHVELMGEVNAEVFITAIKSVVNRHEVLHTVYKSNGLTPYQELVNDKSISIENLDLTEMSTKDKQQMLDRTISTAFNYKFDLTSDILLRVSIVKVEPNKWHVLMLTHHIAVDAWSVNILVSDIVEAYSSFLTTGSIDLPVLPIQYSDYAFWQQKFLSGQRLDKHLRFWQNYLEGMPSVCPFPTDRVRHDGMEHKAGSIFATLAGDMFSKVKQTLRASDVSLFVLMNTAYSILLSRYSRSQDIVVGFPIVNRGDKSLEPLVGYFSNTLLIRTVLDDVMSFNDLLKKSKNEFTDILEHQQMPFEYLVEKLKLGARQSALPVFQHSIILQDKISTDSQANIPGLKFEIKDPLYRKAKCDFSLYIVEVDDQIKLEWEFDQDLFDRSTIENVSNNFLYLLRQLIEHSNEPVLSLPMVAEKEENELLDKINNSFTEYDRGQLAYQLIETQAQLQPDKPALVSNEVQYTYQQMNQRADALAALLIQFGCKHGDVIGVALERTVDAFVWLLAIFKSGAAYLPIDASYPEERIKYIFKDSNTKYIVTSRTLVKYLPINGQTIILTEDYASQTIESSQRASLLCAQNKLSVSSLAYVIYTSGSTGVPKGVMVNHKGLVNLSQSQADKLSVNFSSKVLQFASLSFDASVWEWLMALTHGATLFVCDENTKRSPERLSRELVSNRITHLTLPPSFLALIDNNLDYAFEALVLAGESPADKVVGKWVNQYPLFNAYGPTESTVCATIGKLTADSGIHIGKVINNTQIYILDKQGNLSSKGAVGEIYIGGEGLANGYVNRPELTEKSFVHNPFDDSGVLYRTGDLGRYRSDNNLEFIGRIDNQLKVNGFRIELGEIETALQDVPFISSAVVVNSSSNNESVVLTAFIQFIESLQIDSSIIEDIKACLSKKLPYFMLPTKFVRIDSWPVTVNGKVDKTKLVELQNDSFIDAYVAPQTTIQKELVSNWSSLLSIPAEKISITSNFFEIGGSSLLLIKMLSYVNETYELQLALIDIQDKLSIIELSKCIDGLTLYKRMEKSATQTDFVNEGLF